jgi:hypothetical protein
MASLTEMSFQAKGITVLYIPAEDLDDIDKAAKDKDLIQRLEGLPLSRFYSMNI